MRSATRTAFLAVTCVSSIVTSMSASAADLLGLYVGAGLGKAEVRAPRTFANTGYDFNEHHNSWKAIAGIRPLPFLGAEMEYLDFGKAAYNTVVSTSTVTARAAALFGTLYAPIPVPFFDVYAKFGVARLKADPGFNYHGPTAVGPGSASSCCLNLSSSTDTGFAYGAGMQLKFGAPAVRVEYERIKTSPVEPDMVSLDLTWTF